MRWCIAIAISVIAMGGCDALGLGGHEFEPGDYTYTALIIGPGGGEIRRMGVLRITSSSDASVEGTWDVPEFNTEIELGDWNEDAYLVWARDRSLGILTHRMTPNGGGAACSGRWLQNVGGGLDSRPFTCTVKRQ